MKKQQTQALTALILNESINFLKQKVIKVCLMVFVQILKFIKKIITVLHSFKVYNPEYIPVVVLKNLEFDFSYNELIFSMHLTEPSFKTFVKSFLWSAPLKMLKKGRLTKNYGTVSLLSSGGKNFQLDLSQAIKIFKVFFQVSHIVSDLII